MQEAEMIWKTFEGDLTGLVGYDVRITTNEPHEAVYEGLLRRVTGRGAVVQNQFSVSTILIDEIVKIETEGIDYSQLHIEPFEDPTPEQVRDAMNGTDIPRGVARKAQHSPQVAREIAQGHSDVDAPKVGLDAEYMAAIDYLDTKTGSDVHPFLADVKAQVEKGRSLSEKQVAAVLKFKANDKPKTATPAPAAPTQPKIDVPDGHYAIEEDGELHFFKVEHGKPGGKWAGFLFLSIQASDDYHAIKNRDRKTAVLQAIATDPKAALARYGHEIGRCGICNRTLTDPESIELGIGPVCLGRTGF